MIEGFDRRAEGPPTFYSRYGKRILDLWISLALLVLLSPLFALIALAVWMDDGLPVIFRQTRVGFGGTLFRIYKFRTMRIFGERGGPVTVAGDPRLTRSGRLLRRWKLDELAQLLNVVSGRMSLVGPRPDVPGFADLLRGAERAVLSLRPGITGPASIAYRDEERLLARQADPGQYNRDVIFPAKVRINLEYAANVSAREDLRWLLETLFPRRRSTSTSEMECT